MELIGKNAVQNVGLCSKTEYFFVDVVVFGCCCCCCLLCLAVVVVAVCCSYVSMSIKTITSSRYSIKGIVDIQNQEKKLA